MKTANKYKQKKTIRIVVILIVISFLMSSSYRALILRESKNLKVFLLDPKTSKLVPYKTNIGKEAKEENVNRAIELLYKGVGKKKPAIPKKVEYYDVKILDKGIRINFKNNDLAISQEEKLIVELALVKSLTDFENIYYIELYQEGIPLKISTGGVYGRLYAGDAYISLEEALRDKNSKYFRLYYLNENKKSLATETVKISIPSSVKEEEAVLNKLIEGPESENLHGALSNKIKVTSVYTKDRVCYVNFNEAFFADEFKSNSAELVIYSIVNSLTDLAGVDYVKIINKVDRDSPNRLYKEKINIDRLLKKDLSLLE